jgi:hypothetical protein
MTNRMTVQDASNYKLHEPINMVSGPFERTAEIYQLAVGIDIEKERKWGLKTTNIDRPLEVYELEPERYLCDIRRTQARLSQPHERVFVSTAYECPARHQTL